MKILGGVIGAVLGYIAGVALFALLDLGNRNDPITSGFVALLIAGPIGLIAGTVGGTRLAMALTRKPVAESDGPAVEAGKGLAKNSLISLAIVVGCVTVAGVGYYAYAVATATPWLKPANMQLRFEVRYPAGTVLPPAKDIKFLLVTDINTMPGEVHADKFRSDGDKPVIAGSVDLAFRTRNRMLEVTMPGRPERTYQIRLDATPQHSADLGRWEPHPDGSEFRYRAKWPGKE